MRKIFVAQLNYISTVQIYDYFISCLLERVLFLPHKIETGIIFSMRWDILIKDRCSQSITLNWTYRYRDMAIICGSMYANLISGLVEPTRLIRPDENLAARRQIS